MKFDKPRVFEKRYISGNLFRLTFEDPQAYAVAQCIDGPWKGDIGGPWSMLRAADDGWKEVTPPTDITKLDTAGVFHEVPPSEMTAGRVAYEARAKALSPLHLYQPWDKSDDAKSVAGRKAWEAAAQAVIEFHGDIANATIAELRARVAELEGQIADSDSQSTVQHESLCECGWRSGNLPTLEATDRAFAEHERVCPVDNKFKAELRRQLQSAWMRGDLTTADRIADLIGDRRPSEHEAADAGEVRA